jgi:hypothetical protein
MNILLTSLAIVVFSTSLFAQVGINENNTNPDSSAMLDISSPNKGLLIPRMDSLQRTAISKPAESLMVYDSTTRSFWYWRNKHWEELAISTGNSATQMPAIPDVGLSILNGGYRQLRSTPTQQLTSVVFLEDWEEMSTFDSLVYPHTGGFFYKSADTAIVDDRATVIQAEDGQVWKRQYITSHGYPEWVEIRSGTESDRINHISRIIGNGGTIHFSPRTYLLDKNAEIASNQTWRGQGERSVLKRKEMPDVFLTTDAAAGTARLQIDDPTPFRSGQQIEVVKGGCYDQNNGATLLIVTQVDGNILHLNTGLSRGFSSGDRVIRISALVSAQNSEPLGLLRFHSLTFDGNESENNFTHDWRLNSTIQGVARANKIVLEHCRFLNTPAENVVGGNVDMLYCNGRNLGGSFCHISNPTNYFKETAANNFIGCQIDSVNLIGQGCMSHSEGMITFSLNIPAVFIDNCHVQNAHEAILAPISGEDIGSVYIANSSFKGMNPDGDAFLLATSNANAQLEDFYISNSSFDNCGTFRINANSNAKGYGARNIRLENVRAINSRLYCKDCSDVYIDQCVFQARYDDQFLGFSDRNSGIPAWIVFNGTYENINISNTLIEGHRTVQNVALTGLYFALGHTQTSRKNVDGSSTEFWYPQGIKINNCDIKHFRRGIDYAGNYINLQFTHQVNDWEITNNRFYTERVQGSAAPAWGLWVIPGMTAQYNTIYTTDTANDKFFPLMVSGIQVAIGDATRNQRLMGGAAMYNRVIGSPMTSCRVGHPTNGSWNDANALVMHNQFPNNQIIVTDPAQSTVTDNMILNQLLPNLTDPAVVPYQQVQEETGNY